MCSPVHHALCSLLRAAGGGAREHGRVVAAQLHRAALVGRRRVGRALQLDSIKTRVESAYGVCNQRLKL
jgi:hypothetical protein